MKKYNLLYAKKTAIWIFSIFAAVIILFFVVALFNNAGEYTLLIPLLQMLLGVVIWLFFLLKIPFAVKLLNKQIKELSLSFDDSGAQPLNPSSTIFLSKEWFIASGRLYLHKDFISGVSIKVRKTGRGNDYFCVFKCKDKRHTLHVYSSTDAKRIQKWFKEMIH